MTREDLIRRAEKSVKKREAAMKKKAHEYDIPDTRDKSKKKDKSKAIKH